jgi:predicted  nucleic acid-binding Zn-ribbon protein
MSIAVRVSVWILGVLVVLSAGVAVMTLLQKQSLEGQKLGLQRQISENQDRMADLNSRIKRLQSDAESLNGKVTQAQQEKLQIQSQFDDVKKKSEDLQSQLDGANTDKEDWKSRVDTVGKERDALLQKLKNQPEKIVYKDRIVKVNVPTPAPVALPAAAPAVPAVLPASAPDVTSKEGDIYWASILKQKASLQIELEKEKSQLDQAALQVADLKKRNSDLEVQVKQINNEKDEIVQKIKYGQDLADTLSVDLARSRNDMQAVNDRADKVKEENLQLLSQIRDMSSTKVQLEKTVARLTGEKDTMQKKLVETESVIQSRIDDIWKIKQGLDKKLSENAVSSTPGAVELPPIIVNAPNSQQTPNEALASTPASAAASAPRAQSAGAKNEGAIISINESNNFVILDLGQQNSSVSVGNALRVYRGSNPIAKLEVIQVRKDISAADIKNKMMDLKVGDVVRFE